MMTTKATGKSFAEELFSVRNYSVKDYTVMSVSLRKKLQ